MRAGEWFVVQSGRDKGKVRLVGWSLTAVGSGPGSASPWYALASCPRCGAMVVNDDTGDDVLMGRAVHMHENWHAATDYPRPPSSEPVL